MRGGLILASFTLLLTWDYRRGPIGWGWFDAIGLGRTITSNPSGGHCDLTRKGEHVATLDKTPGTVKVDKTKNDILMTCTLAGYQDASANLESGYGAGTFGNIILGGVIGWGIDSATGADNKYPSSANVQFIPVGVTPPPAPAAKPTLLAPNS